MTCSTHRIVQLIILPLIIGSLLLMSSSAKAEDRDNSNAPPIGTQSAPSPTTVTTPPVPVPAPGRGPAAPVNGSGPAAPVNGPDSQNEQANESVQNQQIQGLPVGNLVNPTPGIRSIQGLILAIAEILLLLAVPIVAAFLVYGGFLYVTARGNEEQVKKAHQTITWTIIGGVVIFGAFAIVQVIQAVVESFR